MRSAATVVYLSTVHPQRDAPHPHAVCVYCASGPTDPALLALAAEVGEAIADRGWTLVWGGYRADGYFDDSTAQVGFAAFAPPLQI